MAGQRWIIFGCGYVGRALARTAVEAGHEVWIHSRNPDSLKQVICIPNHQKVIGDLHSEEWHPRLSGNWDVAINLVSSAGGGLDGYRLSYLGGNRSILKWARQGSVQRFLYTSATSVYPQSDGSVVKEDDVPGLQHLSPSGRILREAELDLLQDTCIPSIHILRLGGIYGPGRHLYLNKLMQGEEEIPGDGATYLNLIHLDDIVSALMQTAGWRSELPPRNLFNVIDNAPTAKQEIVDWLAAELNVPSIPFNPALQGRRAQRRKSSGALPNRRVSNALFKSTLNWSPRHPDYRSGYKSILADR